jgi:hypothetical protein
MLFLYVGVPGAEPLITCNVKVMYAALSFNLSDKSFCRQQWDNWEKLGFFLGVHLALLETHFFVLFSFPSQMKAVLCDLDLLVEDSKWWNFQIPSSN